jgi:hypothetical protein
MRNTTQQQNHSQPTYLSHKLADQRIINTSISTRELLVLLFSFCNIISIMKRKTTAASAASAARSKKPSVLLGKPQNVYVAPSNDMTREELSAWRKEERRKRNRASAAASRHKTQSKIAELSLEVSLWKTRCEDMQDKMMKLQRQVDLLTRAQSPTQEQQQQQQHLVSPPSSHLNSPSSMSLEGQPPIVTSSLDTKKCLPPPLMLSPASLMDQTSSPVENKADITSPSNVDLSKKHLNMISRQA